MSTEPVSNPPTPDDVARFGENMGHVEDLTNDDTPAQITSPGGIVRDNLALSSQKIAAVLDPATGLVAQANAAAASAAQSAADAQTGAPNRPQVRLAAMSGLPANTYANGTAGVGATITITATGVLNINSVAVALNDDVLVGGEATATKNGLYTCTTAGATGVAAVLTRRSTENTPSTLGLACVLVSGADTSWAGYAFRVVQSAADISAIGTAAISIVPSSSANGVAGEAALRASGDQSVSRGVHDYVWDAGFTLPGWAHNIFDEWGNSLGGVESDGLFHIYSGYFDSITGGTAQFDTFMVDSATQLGGDLPPGYAAGVTDDYGNLPWGVKSDGTMESQVAEIGTLNNTNTDFAIANIPSVAPNLPSRYMAFPPDGQSLSLGGSASAMTTTPVYNALRLLGHFDGSGNEVYDGLGPLFEPCDINNTGNIRETPSSGFAKGFLDLLSSENGLAIGSSGLTPIMFNPGVVGSPIAGLVKGSTAYTTFMNQVAAVNGYVRARGGRLVVATVPFFQTEADYNLNTPASNWSPAVAGLQANAEADIRAITGQTEPVYFVIYTCDSHVEHGRISPTLAMASYDLAVNNPKFSLGPVMYGIEANTDGIHRTAKGYNLAGFYAARTSKRIVVDQLNPNSCFLRYTNFWSQGNNAQITCHVPRLPLKFAPTTDIPAILAAGFQVRDPSTLAPLAVDITVALYQSTIDLQFMQGGSAYNIAGKLLTCAWAGSDGVHTSPTDRPRSTICDSTSTIFDGGFYTSPTNYRLPPYQWLP